MNILNNGGGDATTGTAGEKDLDGIFGGGDIDIDATAAGNTPQLKRNASEESLMDEFNPFVSGIAGTSETDLNISGNINLDNVRSNGVNSDINYLNMDDMQITELVSCLWANERLIIEFLNIIGLSFGNGMNSILKDIIGNINNGTYISVSQCIGITVNRLLKNIISKDFKKYVNSSHKNITSLLTQFESKSFYFLINYLESRQFDSSKLSHFSQKFKLIQLIMLVIDTCGSNVDGNLIDKILKLFSKNEKFCNDNIIVQIQQFNGLYNHIFHNLYLMIIVI